MARLIAIQAGLFVLPFLLFWLYVKIGRKPTLPRPTFWLVLIGLALGMIGFVAVGLTTSDPDAEASLVTRDRGE